MHIRRGDKLVKEAKFHALDEYMQHVDDYYLRQEMEGKKMKRRVYLASDDRDVYQEAKER